MHADPQLYRFLLALRRSTPALSIGGYCAAAADDNVLAYERRHEGDRLLIILNLSSEQRQRILPFGTHIVEILASTLSHRAEDDKLRENEGVILRLGNAI